MGTLSLIALAMILGAWLVFEVQEKKKADEKQKQKAIALNKDLEEKALKTLLQNLLGGYVARHGVFDEDEAFSKRPDPRHVRVLGMEQGRAKVIWDHVLARSVGDNARDAREFADLMTEINLDLPDYMSNLMKKRQNLSIDRANLDAQYQALCAKNPMPDEQIMIQGKKLQEQHAQITQEIAIIEKLISIPNLRIANIHRSKRDVVIVLKW